MAGLPLDSWILIIASVGLGLGLEIAFLRARRVVRARRAATIRRKGRPDDAPPEGRP